MHITRKLIFAAQEAARFFRAVAILGPRQSGKTTLAQHAFPSHRYVSLEDLDVRLRAETDPRLFLQEYPNEHGIILDEIQNVPSLLSYIQTIVDEKKQNGFFVFTGSQNFLLNESISQTLAGRIAILTLYPLSIQELELSGKLPAQIEEAVYKGGYPAVYAENVPVDKMYANYIRTYVERDVRQIKKITNLNAFQNFLLLCAGRIGQLLNISSLANDCGIDIKTAHEWISILEASYIIFLLYPYYKNFGKRVIKTPKLFFVDTGVACSLLNIKDQDQLLEHYMRGPLVESYIISDLYKQYYNIDTKPSLFFWRDYQGQEFDCLVEEALFLAPIEIKAGRTISQHFFKQFEYWKEVESNIPSHNFVIYTGADDQTWPKAKVLTWKSAGSFVQNYVAKKKLNS